MFKDNDQALTPTPVAMGVVLLLNTAVHVLPFHQKESDSRLIATPKDESRPVEVPVEVDVSSTAVPLIVNSWVV